MEQDFTDGSGWMVFLYGGGGGKIRSWGDGDCNLRLTFEKAEEDHLYGVFEGKL